MKKTCAFVGFFGVFATITADAKFFGTKFGPDFSLLIPKFVGQCGELHNSDLDGSISMGNDLTYRLRMSMDRRELTSDPGHCRQISAVDEDHLVFLVEQRKNDVQKWPTDEEIARENIKFVFELGAHFRVYSCAVEDLLTCDRVFLDHRKELVTMPTTISQQSSTVLDSDLPSVVYQPARWPPFPSRRRDIKRRMAEQVQPDFYWDVLKHLTGHSPLPYVNLTATAPEDYRPVPPYISPDSRAFRDPIESRWSTTISSRYTFSQFYHGPVTNYVHTYFASLGFSVQLLPWSVVGIQPSYNVVAYRLGTKKPQEIVLVGAHSDSTSERPYERAPGAVDDGSGTAGVMQLAYALSKQKQPGFERTIMFALFSGEEQGLLGSKHFVSQLQQNQGIVLDNGIKAHVSAAILMDMIAYSNKFFGVTVEGTLDRSIQELMRTIKHNMQELSPDLTVHSTNVSFGSDHVSFQRANIPAVLLIEQDDTNYPYYHRSSDDLNESNVDREQATAILRGLAGTIVDLAVN